jgi:hypothetical protein
MKIEVKELEEKIHALSKNRNSFADFLEEKMDEFDYSNTTLAKKSISSGGGQGDEGNPFYPGDKAGHRLLAQGNDAGQQGHLCKPWHGI